MIPTLLLRGMPCALSSLGLSVLLTTQALAQPAPTVRRADPLDARAPVPALRYESVLAQYRRLGDEPTVPWREANDAVARIGGWRAYAREAQQADPPASAPAAAQPPGATPAGVTPVPMPAGHGGHHRP